MKAHWSYFKYIVRHKWFVFLACRQCGVSLWRSIIHDWHKFLPSEWKPYVETFYSPDGSKKKYAETDAFARAWNYQQKRGKHHWQYWLLTWDRGGESVPIEMPIKYIQEMVADWWGAGRAITGEWNARNWYLANKDKMKFTTHTRLLVEICLDNTKFKFDTPEMIAQRVRIFWG